MVLNKGAALIFAAVSDTVQHFRAGSRSAVQQRNKNWIRGNCDRVSSKFPNTTMPLDPRKSWKNLFHSLRLSLPLSPLALCSQSWQPQTPLASEVTGGGPNTCAHAEDNAAHCLHTGSHGAAAANDAATESHCVTPAKSGLLSEVLRHFGGALGSERGLTVRVGNPRWPTEWQGLHWGGTNPHSWLLQDMSALLKY